MSRKSFILAAAALGLCTTAISFAQTRGATPPAAKTSTTPPKAVPAVDLGRIEGRTYTNDAFKFEVAVPEGWLVADTKAESSLTQQGIDLRLKAPKAATAQDQIRLDGYAKRVTVLLTAFRPKTGDENAMMRVAVEDLRRVPQVKDAVDYFDLMREGYRTMRLPSDFKYSETQAEKLGRKQFGFLDTSLGGAKTRMYATVRNGYAILFTLNYETDDELQAFRRMIANGNFSLK